MPKVTDEHRAAMRERIQSAAVACVGRKGFSSVSMADIIAEAGLSAGAVYVYYRSKEELVVDVGRRVFEERMAALEQLGARSPVPHPAEAVTSLMEGLSDSDLFPGVAVQVWGEAVRNEGLQSVAQGIIAEIIGHLERYLAGWLAGPKGLMGEDAAAEARLLAPAVLGLVQGFAIQTALGGRDAGARYVESARGFLAAL